MKNCFTAFAGVLISLTMSVSMAVAAEKMQLPPGANMNQTPQPAMKVEPQVANPQESPSSGIDINKSSDQPQKAKQRLMQDKPMPQSAAGQVIKTQRLTPQQFDQLKDTDVIEHQGTQYTVGEIRAKMRSAEAEALAKRKEVSSKTKQAFEAYRQIYLKEQNAKIEAENAKMRVKAQKLRSAASIKAGVAIKNTDVITRSTGEPAALGRSLNPQREALMKSGAAPTPTPVPTPAPAPVSSQPAITGVLGKLSPAMTMLIQGSGFGNNGEIRAALPSGKLQTLEVLSWSENLVEGKLPINTWGSPDGTATITLFTGSRVSNNFQVPFKALRALDVLDPRKVTVLNCAQADARNKCSSESGSHEGWVFGSSGTDRFRLAALNDGWVFHSCELRFQNSQASACTSFQPGAASATLEVPWSYDALGKTEYRFMILVEGPRLTESQAVILRDW